MTERILERFPVKGSDAVQARSTLGQIDRVSTRLLDPKGGREYLELERPKPSSKSSTRQVIVATR